MTKKSSSLKNLQIAIEFKGLKAMQDQLRLQGLKK